MSEIFGAGYLAQLKETRKVYMQRELRELQLPKSKVVKSVKIVTYYTRKEETAIEKVRWDNTIYAMDEVAGEPRLKEMKGSYIVEQQDVELCQGVKAIVYKDDTVKESASLTNDDILNLPGQDVKIIMKELSKCWLDPDATESEKKSQSKNSQTKSEG